MSTFVVGKWYSRPDNPVYIFKINSVVKEGSLASYREGIFNSEHRSASGTIDMVFDYKEVPISHIRGWLPKGHVDTFIFKVGGWYKREGSDYIYRVEAVSSVGDVATYKEHLLESVYKNAFGGTLSTGFDYIEVPITDILDYLPDGHEDTVTHLKKLYPTIPEKGWTLNSSSVFNFLKEKLNIKMHYDPMCPYIFWNTSLKGISFFKNCASEKHRYVIEYRGSSESIKKSEEETQKTTYPMYKGKGISPTPGEVHTLDNTIKDNLNRLINYGDKSPSTDEVQRVASNDRQRNINGTIRVANRGCQGTTGSRPHCYPSRANQRETRVVEVKICRTVIHAKNF